MTESELELLRIKLRMEALQILLRGLYVAAANALPDAAPALLGEICRASQSSVTNFPERRPSRVVGHDFGGISGDIGKYPPRHRIRI